VAFVSVTEGFDTTTAMGRAMLSVAAVLAQLTREMIAENTKDGLLRRAEAGFYRGNPTSLYGYDYSTDQGLLVVNENEATNVRQIFDYYTENKWGRTELLAPSISAAFPQKAVRKRPNGQEAGSAMC
jgi:site-specific DNA recombinase